MSLPLNASALDLGRERDQLQLPHAGGTVTKCICELLVSETLVAK